MNDYLIEKYFQNSLTEAEKKALHQELQDNPTLAEEWRFQQLIEESLQKQQRNSLKSKILEELDVLEEIGEIKPITTLKDSTQNLGDRLSAYVHENLNLLQQWFTPYPYPSIARGGNLEILHPIKNFNAEYTLDFELKKPINLKLSLSIFNHKNELVFAQKIPPRSQLFRISLVPMTGELHPGWYYWQLGHSRIGEVKRPFFIHAELQPTF